MVCEMDRGKSVKVVRHCHHMAAKERVAVVEPRCQKLNKTKGLTYRLFYNRSLILLPNRENSFEEFTGRFQIVNEKKWIDFDDIFLQEHKTICKSFDFKYEYLTGKFNSIEFNDRRSYLHCGKTIKTLRDCRLKFYKSAG
ncbi:DgyrCDS14414 [Dimorphilus gyrociliatus]|uniref:DgyrCDS14414 n=1 Tax=Dimorphilus gyrociliatus TaxID=2664684 RepID=A0A7I8WDQ1_9ANNE|nr:DgyrCDS14414 [Dimorphilus gyrociliatus]